MTSRSKYVNDNASTVHRYHQPMCEGSGAYDNLKQKSLLDVSIRTGQSIEELLQNNSNLANLI